MIQLACNITEESIRQMWKICFDDSDEFMNLYFSEKYKNENTLVYVENGKAIASLQMLPYRFTFCGTEIPVGYISGACTLPEFRNKGIMSQLLISAFNMMRRRHIPLSILIPAESWLYDYYAKYGYEKVFDKDDTEIPLKKILDEAEGDYKKAYSIFNKEYQHQDFTILKSEVDFETIIKDAILDDFPVKTNLSGMARIIDVSTLCGYYAKRCAEKSVSFEVKDNYLMSNDGVYQINAGKSQLIHDKSSAFFRLEISMLCRLLMGYRLENLPFELAHFFEPHKPTLSLMLE